MKRKIIVILLGLCMIVVVSINYLSTVTFDKDTYEVYPSFLQQYKIKKEFQKVKEDISHIVSSDAMNGYSLSSGDQSLSLDGVEHIYQYFQDKDVCVYDEQKYENFQNKDLFLDFWKTYKDQESSLTIYKILHTGSIERLDLISSKHKLYALTTVFDQQIKISGRLIKSISYDQYGYLLIHYQFCKDEIALGAMQYDYMKIDGIDKQLREYNRKYIEPIGYYCNNLFTTNWDETTLDTIHFNDLVEYLYARDYDRPFPGSTYPNRQNHLMVRSIPSDVYEKLVMDHFALNHEQVKKYSDYDEDTDTYPWIEAYCVPSHFELPECHPEVIGAKMNDDILTLQVRSEGYSGGIPVCFEHIVKIRMNHQDFQYISNEVIPSPSNQIPENTYEDIPFDFGIKKDK